MERIASSTCIRVDTSLLDDRFLGASLGLQRVTSPERERKVSIDSVLIWDCLGRHGIVFETTVGPTHAFSRPLLNLFIFFIYFSFFKKIIKFILFNIFI
jgi:hypothetical protein